MNTTRERQVGKPAPTPEELAAKAARRRRGVQVSTFCLHGMAWVVLTYYSTDYLPPLAIRGLVGLDAAQPVQFLVGYVTLSVVCALLGLGFGTLYAGRMAASRYPWRWFLFPLIVAIVLIPPQGNVELLSASLELIFLLGGMLLGRRIPRHLGPSLPRYSRGPGVEP